MKQPFYAPGRGIESKETELNAELKRIPPNLLRKMGEGTHLTQPA